MFVRHRVSDVLRSATPVETEDSVPSNRDTDELGIMPELGMLRQELDLPPLKR